MTTSALTTDCLDSIGFTRLHALVARGYRPDFGASTRNDGHVCINLFHPRAGRKNPPPPVTLWSDGIVSTSKVLWPEKYVPEEDKGPPDWQRFILPGEADRFANFVAGIVPPDVVDLYVKPAWSQAKLFLVKFMFGASICVVLAVATKIVLAEI